MQSLSIVTLVARSVLRDCRIAHSLLEAATDADRWRVHWIGALTLLRLVGDALDKVDKRDPKWADAIKNNWKKISNKDENPIFWDFIKASRDAAVHEYELAPYDDDTIPLFVSEGIEAVERFDLDECMFKPLERGYGAGEDARDIYLEGIEWWEIQLSEIERSVKS